MGSGIVFWNVDTQKDFVEPNGKLYVKDAEKLKPIWEEIRNLAAEKNIRVVNTADYHFPDAPEISETPDFIHTFPQHCMAGSEGSEYVDETRPDKACTIHWDKKIPYGELYELIGNSRNCVILKNVFDMFAGNPNTEDVLKIMDPETVIVYGVTTNVCVDFAVKGLAGRVKNVYVIKDAIKELPLIPLPFDEWGRAGVKLIKFNDLKDMLA